MTDTLTRKSRAGAGAPPRAARPDGGPGVVFAADPPPTGLVSLTFTVSALLHARLADSAHAARQSIGSFAATLLGTAYMAKFRPTGKPVLDDVVARAVVLSRTHNTAEIAAATGLSEASVTQVIALWRAEIARGGAA